MRALNLPNLLTLLRLLGAPQIPLALLTGYNPLWFVWNTDFRVGTFTFAAILAITDLLDGTLAKWLKQETPLGQWLDPIADFSFCTSLFIGVFVIYEDFPVLQVAWMVFALYFAWYVQTVTRSRKSGKIRRPNQDAKLGMGALMISLLCVLIGTFMSPFFVWHSMAIIGVIVSVILTLNSLEQYEKNACCEECTRTDC